MIYCGVIHCSWLMISSKQWLPLQSKINPNNIDKNSGIEIPEAWIPTISQHNTTAEYAKGFQLSDWLYSLWHDIKFHRLTVFLKSSMFYWDILCKYFPSDYFFKRATSQKNVKSYDISLFKKSCIVSYISRYLGCAMLCCVVLYCCRACVCSTLLGSHTFY